MVKLKTQIAESHSGNLEENTWTLEGEKPLIICAGKFAIVDKFVYDDLLSFLIALKDDGARDKLSQLINYLKV